MCVQGEVSGYRRTVSTRTPGLPDPGQFPHCDQSVLHAPRECEYCDRRPLWQALREAWGIAYTGHEPEPLYEGGPFQAPCPSDYRRGTGQAHVWGGNRPTNVPASELPAETLQSRVMYGPGRALAASEDEDSPK